MANVVDQNTINAFLIRMVKFCTFCSFVSHRNKMRKYDFCKMVQKLYVNDIEYIQKRGCCVTDGNVHDTVGRTITEWYTTSLDS